MTELFISPILLDYKYLDNICQEAKGILKLQLEDEKSEKELRLSMFFNFNRYLIMEIEMMSTDVKDGLYETLAELMEDHKEKETIDILSKLGILPEIKEEFMGILKRIK
jgi:hypothetical protein